MKTSVIVIILFVLVYSNSNAQEQKNNDNFMQVQMLINNDLDDNYGLIREKSAGLTETQKFYIYDDKKVSAGLPFVLNFIIGYGIGSWVQGHTTGGLIGTIGNLGGLILIFAADDRSTATIGLVVLLGTWLVDCILPFTYSSYYNNKLKSALGINSITNLMILPNVNITQNGNIAPGLMLNVNF